MKALKEMIVLNGEMQERLEKLEDSGAQFGRRGGLSMTVERAANPTPPSPYDRYHRWLRLGLIGAVLLELVCIVSITNSEAFHGTRAMRVFVLWALIAATVYGYISYERHNTMALAQDPNPIRLLVTRFLVLLGIVLISGTLVLLA